MNYLKTRPLLSICIPSYNRPVQIGELLSSIDCKPENVEIIICEDMSPKRLAINSVVESFKNNSIYRTCYYENEVNLGYDGNIRRLVELATGQFVLFMGDDDLFVPNALDQYLTFLNVNINIKYVLRSYISIHSDGRVETFRYLPKTTVLPPGEETVAWLFKRSVTISGFTISRDAANAISTSDLDGTLLYQIYLMANVCLDNESIYYDLPVAHAVQSFRGNNPHFGASEAEKGRYTPGVLSAENSINFTKAYFEVTEYLDRQHSTELTKRVKLILSKYSYPFLSIQRRNGIVAFLKYAKRLEREVGFGCTPYFHIYKWGLVFLGEKLFDRIIVRIKNTLGYTPDF